MDDYLFEINTISFKNGEKYSPRKINIVIGGQIIQERANF